MAGSHVCFSLFLMFISAVHSFQFPVGGRGVGWKLNPSEDYNHWAGRMRFQVNDTLLFKYKKGADSVLQVNEEDYQKCNTKIPIAKWEDGKSVFKFNRSGPFFFISGKTSNCNKGQKLITVVLAVRHRHPLAPSPAVGEAPGPSAKPELGADSPDGEAPRSSFAVASSWASPSVVVVSVIIGVSFGGFLKC